MSEQERYCLLCGEDISADGEAVPVPDMLPFDDDEGWQCSDRAACLGALTDIWADEPILQVRIETVRVRDNLL